MSVSDAPMTCPIHPERTAPAACHDCRAALCAECMQSALGQTFCARCLAQRLQAPVAGPSLKLPWLALALSFFIPGLGQVYNGLVKRGLVQLAGWWVMFWLQTRSSPGLTVLLLGAFVGYWIWQFVDAYGAARSVNHRGRGETLRRQQGDRFVNGCVVPD